MRATSRSILAAGTIATAAIVGAGVTVLGADDPDVTTRLGQVGPSTSVDFITVPRSVASTSTSTSSTSTSTSSSTSTSTSVPATTPDTAGTVTAPSVTVPVDTTPDNTAPDNTGPDNTGPDVTVTTIDDRGGDDDNHQARVMAATTALTATRVRVTAGATTTPVTAGVATTTERQTSKKRDAAMPEPMAPAIMPMARMTNMLVST